MVLLRFWMDRRDSCSLNATCLLSLKKSSHSCGVKTIIKIETLMIITRVLIVCLTPKRSDISRKITPFVDVGNSVVERFTRTSIQPWVTWEIYHLVDA